MHSVISPEATGNLCHKNNIKKVVMPFFTVAVTTYKRPDILVDALESVIAQTFTDFELLIVDDASPDNTEQVVQQFIQKAQQQRDSIKIIYYRNPTNSGISASRNAVVQQAKGKFIVYLDDDDLLTEDYLSQIYAAVKDAPERVGFAIPGHRMFQKLQTGDVVLQKENTYDCVGPTYFKGEQYIKRARGGGSGLIVRHTAALSNGEWSSNFRTGGDIDYILRLASKWDWMIIPNAFLHIYNLNLPQLTHSRIQAAKTLEQLGDVHADRFMPFPETHRNYYLNAARTYYGAKAYQDGWRAMGKAIRISPFSLFLWKFIIKIHLALLFPMFFRNVFSDERHGKH